MFDQIEELSHITIIEKAQRLSPWLIELHLDFRRQPKLALQEFRKLEKVSKVLSEIGISHETGFARTGVTGVPEGDEPGPWVALRAEMEALQTTVAMKWLDD